MTLTPIPARPLLHCRPSCSYSCSLLCSPKTVRSSRRAAQHRRDWGLHCSAEDELDVRRLVPRYLVRHLAATHARHTPVFVPSLLLQIVHRAHCQSTARSNITTTQLPGTARGRLSAIYLVSANCARMLSARACPSSAVTRRSSAAASTCREQTGKRMQQNNR
jgi:hypothetical protein